MHTAAFTIADASLGVEKPEIFYSQKKKKKKKKKKDIPFNPFIVYPSLDSEFQAHPSLYH
jgi:hypothetical protein